MQARDRRLWLTTDGPKKKRALESAVAAARARMAAGEEEGEEGMAKIVAELVRGMGLIEIEACR